MAIIGTNVTSETLRLLRSDTAISWWGSQVWWSETREADTIL